MARTGRTSTLAFLVVSLAAAAGWAQDADALLDRGVELRSAGQDEAALRVFQQAWEVRRSPRALVQIALAEQALGRWVDAEIHLAEALSDAQDPWVRRRHRALDAALGEIRQHVGRLELQANVPGAEVLIGGRVVGVLPLAAMLHVQTGPVTVTVRARGFVSVTRTLSVEGRAPRREVVTLDREPPVVPMAAAAAALTPARDHPTAGVGPPRAGRAGSTRRTVGFGLLGVGAAALVVSGVFFGLNASLGSATADATPGSAEPYGAWARFQADENFGRGRTGAQVCELARVRTGADAAQVRDLCASTSSTATITLVAGLAGGALAATGLVLALTARPTAASTARWGLAPWLARGPGATLYVAW